MSTSLSVPIILQSLATVSAGAPATRSYAILIFSIAFVGGFYKFKVCTQQTFSTIHAVC